jgi:hypothetical protein
MVTKRRNPLAGVDVARARETTTTVTTEAGVTRRVIPPPTPPTKYEYAVGKGDEIAVATRTAGQGLRLQTECMESSREVVDSKEGLDAVIKVLQAAYDDWED